ncbi:peptidylprolyl isomerase [Enterovibrio norvegicus]|uniref:Peptidyl-prolyl cis-trans isomerase n=1 Tax=Enterovibrio norvegicus TaxID=188144 RepID=A0ABV4KYW1_9GAMM|nr:peptidylprolyl isomerase [Enterovibrio norvegicus]MCC4799952.1 peptidylprolyl isomerase [Enterovibrio norvegicus]OEE44432.1 peptidylprolyl isomerase [Enterovibrio norvegicus]OEF54994.1 peptidylprolyl isomerase [Enterovibrio norvegicus]OEF65117.1 peptidylprolyl isomerase [Enterovibrio norvegicus]PMH61852.1 peptidylprolyl isomerase [Enterovibrio norvegicus]
MKNLLKAALTAGFMLASLSAWAANPIVNVTTTDGNFSLELYPEKAPKTVANFLRYVEDGSYVGTQFHRVIKGFVVQGGGFDKSFERRPSYEEVVNESKNGLSNSRGTIAMARTSDPDSATRQFYINLQNNSNLDGTDYKFGYTVFGKVIQGFTTVEKIASVKTVTIPDARMRDVPQQPILIEKMTITTK